MALEKRWNVIEADAGEVENLRRQLTIHQALCKLLVQRGAKTYDLAKAYFRPQLGDVHNPFLMKDMDKAVNRLDQALRDNERILVFGDYDVDGTTSVACMYMFLRDRHQNVDFYIPHRYREGYGVSREGIDYAIKTGCKLIIALDCGIKSVHLVKYAKDNGVDFIICDHHMPDAQVPEAIAILNAKQPDCPYPYKELCGCGVGLKFIHAFCLQKGLPDHEWQQYLDLVATAIAADIVPMTGENRILTYYGLKKVNENPSVGIRALMKLSDLKPPVHVTNLVFVIAPRVNAAGRMDDARKAVEMFIEQDFEKATELAKILQEDNSERREADSCITEEALALIDADPALQQKKTTVLYQQHWHKGVVGIVASRMVDKYYRPTIILTESGEKISGSARSVMNFNIYEALHSCRDLLDNYGGHFYAAGLTLKKENFEEFCELFETVVSTTITEEMLIPEIVIDAEVDFKDLSLSFYNILLQMEPYGPENLRPVFITRNVYETGHSRVVKDLHLKFSLKQDAEIMDGIGFGMAEKFELLKPNVALDVVYTLDLNTWNGNTRLQLRVIDIKPSNEARSLNG